MFDMLDVAIGIVFVFLLVSLIASGILEVLESWLKMRSKDLLTGINELLRDPNVRDAIYNHSLVNGLYKGANVGAAQKAGTLPSYIPPRNFALALMDVVFSTAGNADGTNGATPQPPAPAIAVQPGGSVSPAPAAAPATVNLAALPPVPPAAPPPAGAPPAAAPPAVNADLARTLRVLAGAAGLDPARTRENIENWYNTAMDRVSGWYKRRAQWCLLVIGLVLAIAMNIDAIRITRELALNKTLRDGVVNKAIAFNKQQQPGAATPSTPAPTTYTDAKTAKEQLAGLGLPIGWQSQSGDWKDWMSIAWMIAGWLITAFAVSLGAPFWFDILNKFIVVRSTVKPEEKSGTEAPKEPAKK
jgi:hypothetical protein